LLYWYKYTNTEASAALQQQQVVEAMQQEEAHRHLLALLVQKPYKKYK
jgi:hypothetical protein